MNSIDHSKEVAEGLRAARSRKNVSQAEVARAIGANPSTVSAWENRGGIGIEEAWALADYYGISLDRLAGREAS